MRWLTNVVFCLVAVAPAIAEGPAPSQQQAQFEVRYMSMMIDHHMMAVEMADYCQTAAVHAELRSLCAEMESTQRAEIEELKTWLHHWYGVTDNSSMMNHGGMQQMERLNSLTGAAYEIEFLKQMIRHHWMAVVQSAKCTERAAHEELVSFCADVVETQTAEIRQMRTWLCEWYQLCNYGPKAGEMGNGGDPACADQNPRGNGMGRGRR